MSLGDTVGKWAKEMRDLKNAPLDKGTPGYNARRAGHEARRGVKEEIVKKMPIDKKKTFTIGLVTPEDAKAHWNEGRHHHNYMNRKEYEEDQYKKSMQRGRALNKKDGALEMAKSPNEKYHH